MSSKWMICYTRISKHIYDIWLHVLIHRFIDHHCTAKTLEIRTMKWTVIKLLQSQSINQSIRILYHLGNFHVWFHETKGGWRKPELTHSGSKYKWIFIEPKIQHTFAFENTASEYFHIQMHSKVLPFDMLFSLSSFTYILAAKIASYVLYSQCTQTGQYKKGMLITILLF